MTERKMYVTTARGHFAVLVWWNSEYGGFWEPWATGIGSYRTKEEAAEEGREWAQAEGLEFR